MAMMNPSGSEFTLRVAICDLVERLKRMQHKCSYLEGCRNQLVKEVIRLRLQNEWLAKQINDSPEISSLPQNSTQCFCNQQSLVNPNNLNNFHALHCHLNGTQIQQNEGDSTGSNRDSSSDHTRNSADGKDESIHLMHILNEFDQEDLDNHRRDSIRQLTIQMLKDLDEELKTGQLKSGLIELVKNSQTPATGQTQQQQTAQQNELIKFDDQEVVNTVLNKDSNQQQTDDYEAFNNNSDYYSNSHHLNVQSGDLRFARNLVNKNKSFSVMHGTSTKNCDSNFLINDNDNQNNNNNNNTNDIPKNNNDIQRRSTATLSKNQKSQQQSALSNISIDPGSEQEILSIINVVKNNLKYLHQGVVSHTEKLNKIKSQKLRNFFQKQINLDSTSATSPNSTIVKQ